MNVPCVYSCFGCVLCHSRHCSARPSTKNFERSAMESILSDLQAHPQAWPFKEPVNAQEVPDYYDVIQNPMGPSYYHYGRPILLTSTVSCRFLYHGA